MSKFNFLLNTFLFRTIHYASLTWDKREWCIALKALRGSQNTDEIENLEREICRLTGSKYAVAYNYGRSAIQVALQSYNFPLKCEVILPSFCCTGVIMPVIQAGLTPVLVDIDNDFNIRAESVREAITEKTCAIILPHLSGKFANDTQQILQIAKNHGLIVIEDACQAFGLVVDGKMAGSFGDVGIFSFGGCKTFLGSGGGILFTNDNKVISYCQSNILRKEETRPVKKRLYQFMWRYGLQRILYPFIIPHYLFNKVRYRINQGLSNIPVEIDSLENYRFNLYAIDPIEAALAYSQLKRAEEIVNKMSENAKIIISANILSQIGLQTSNSTNHNFSKLLVTTGKDRERSRSIISFLRDSGIETESSYTPLHLRKPFTCFRHTSMIITDNLWPGAFYLPNNSCLNNNHMNKIIKVLKNYSRARSERP